MHWITGLIGAFFGASMGEAGVGFLGAVVGLALGWHFGRHLKWSARLKALEDKLARLEGRAAVEAVRAARESAPEPIAAAPVAPDMSAQAAPSVILEPPPQAGPA